MLEMWTYRADVILEPAVDLTGFKVEARDGSIGKVEDSVADAGKSFILVDTGPWIFGKKVILPAQAIERIDPDERTVWVDLTKDQIKNAPEYDPNRGLDESYRTQLADYYGRTSR
jgi:hypothetical protein